jgi:hypothetical protein
LGIIITVEKIVSGEEKAWDTLLAMDPADVCNRTGAEFDHDSGIYSLRSFGLIFTLDPKKKEIRNIDPEGAIFLGRLNYFFGLSLLWYLVKAVGEVPSGKLVKPVCMPGGDIFFRGTHVLPLESIAKKYGTDREGFLAKGRVYGGRPVAYGDAAIELRAMPKIPVTLILWLEDEEWPPRADLLFDSTASAHFAVDVLWSVAMMSVLVFL